MTHSHQEQMVTRYPPFHTHFIPVKESILGFEGRHASTTRAMVSKQRPQNPLMPEKGYLQQATLPNESRVEQELIERLGTCAPRRRKVAA